MGAHINERGEWQSDKYEEWCKPDFVPLKVTDADAQPFLWRYAKLHEKRDAEFSEDLRVRLRALGYEHREPQDEQERIIIELCGFGGETTLEDGEERPVRAVEAAASMRERLEEAERAVDELQARLRAHDPTTTATKTMAEVLAILSEHAGEAGGSEGEGAVDVLRRLIREAGRESLPPEAEKPDSLRNARAGAEWQIYQCYGCGAAVEATMAEVPAAARCPACGERMTHKASWPADTGGYGSRTDLERLVSIGSDGYYQRTKLKQRPGQKIQVAAVELLVDGELQRIDYPEPVDAEDPDAPVCLPVYVPHGAETACSPDNIDGEALAWWEQNAERQQNLSPKHSSLHAYRSGACRHGTTPPRYMEQILERGISKLVAFLCEKTAETNVPDRARTVENAVVYHTHLDGCQRCSDQPFNPCPDGARLLQTAATGGSALPDFPPPPPPTKVLDAATANDILGGPVQDVLNEFGVPIEIGPVQKIPGLAALPDFPPPPPPPPPRIVKLWQGDAEVEATEGSRLEWDVIEGVAAPGTGAILRVIHSRMDDTFPSVFCVWVDPNNRLRELSAELREAFKHNTWPGDGLSGDGGFIFTSGWNFCMAVQRGQVRVLPERCDVEPYLAKLREEQARNRRRSRIGQLARQMASYALRFVEDSCGPDVDALAERFGEILTGHKPVPIDPPPAGATGRNPASPSLCSLRTVYACPGCSTVLITNWVRRTVSVGGPDPSATTFEGYLQNVKNIYMCVECGRETITWPCTPALDAALANQSEALPDFPPPPSPPPTKVQAGTSGTIGDQLLRIAELCTPPEPVATVREYLLQLRAINAAFEELSVMLRPLAHVLVAIRAPEFGELFMPVEHIKHWKYLAIALAVSTAKLETRYLPGQQCSECHEPLSVGCGSADDPAYHTTGEDPRDLCASCACNWALGEALRGRLREDRAKQEVG